MLGPLSPGVHRGESVCVCASVCVREREEALSPDKTITDGDI